MGLFRQKAEAAPCLYGRERIGMNVYITKINGRSFMDPAQYKQYMTAEIADQIGCREMGIYRYNVEAESTAGRSSRFDGIIAGMTGKDLVICQFPTGNGLKFERAFVNHLKAYHARVAIFIHELEPLAYGNEHAKLQETIELYNQAEVLIVPTYAMQNYLSDHGIRNGMKFVIQEMWDYTVDGFCPILNSPAFRREICYADNSGFLGMDEWEFSVPLKLYNVSSRQGSSAQVHYMGRKEPGQLLLDLSKGGFGLVWYQDEDSHRYMEYSASFALARYLAAGIPVIVPAGISCGRILTDNHVGIVVNSLREAAAAVEAMTESEYQEYIRCVAEFGTALKKGYYTKKCLIEAIWQFYRKDAGRHLIPETTCCPKDYAIIFTVLKESYGGNLALSWNCKGKPDGFLICDAASGKALRDIRNGYQHYDLIRDCGKEHGFVVKAYLDTLRGKLIIAESEETYLQPEKCKSPKVSLIMPAYNAEDYLARSIDTALAQSFTDMELIIVNDGSTDQTQTIIDWYQERYPQIKSIRQSNEGQAAARNHGVEYAKGDYISYMDSDDMLRPDMIERLFRSIEKNECEISMSSAYQITKEGYEEVGAYSVKEDTPIATEDFFEHYIRYAYSVVWGKLYKKNLVKAHPIPAVMYEDSAWIPYILSFAEKICYINAHLYEYDRTIRSATAIHNLMEKPMEEQYRNRRDYIMFFLKNGNPQKRDFLKRLALGYTLGFLEVFSDPRFKEFRQEIEQLWN